MNRRSGLGLAGLFLFSITLVCAQTQSQAPAQTPAQAPPQAAPETPSQASSPVPVLQPAKNPFDAYQQFSASVSGGPLRWDKMKIYRSGIHLRAEYVYENEIRITNQEKKNVWFIRPREWAPKPKQCGPMTLMDAASYPFFAYSDSEFSVERSTTVGNETIDGHSCKVENYTFKPKDGRPITIKVKLWEADDLKGFPIQVDVESSATGKFTIHYSDVNLNPPDPKLFKVPVNCPPVKKPAKGETETTITVPATSKPASKPPSPPQ